MACPAIITGERFLTRAIEHLDCQAQTLGTFGYQALGQPGSLASTVMTGLLTLFVALIGLRFLFGPGPGVRDIVFDALKVGVVLTLAFSWPAYRTVVHDVVVSGPAEVAAAMSPSSENARLVDRLQRVDNGIVGLTEIGSGRSSTAILGEEPGATFAGTSLQDDAAFGWSRLIYLASTLGTFGLLRLLAGLLLALAPLAAGLLLFEATRGLFAGWLRGLVLTMLGMIGVSVVLSVELAVLQPWIDDATRVRALGYGTPSGPIELFAMTVAFGIIQLGMIWLLTRVAFMRGWPTLRIPDFPVPQSLGGREPAAASEHPIIVESRANRMADSVERLIERRETGTTERIGYRTLVESRGNSGGEGRRAPETVAGPSDRLGSSYRRTSHRSSLASRRREGDA